MTKTSDAPGGRTHTTGCCIVGAGPAGMFLAVLLARQGVDVTLLEAHKDFDRDFRGDTVHPSTLELLHDLGLSRAVHALPHGKMDSFTLHTPGGDLVMARLSQLPSRFPYVMMLPQAELLNLLADYARRFPNLRLELGASVDQLLRDGDSVRGVVYHQDGALHHVRATLTVGADGRFSKLRKLAGFEPVRSAPPMDVVWLRLPRQPGDPGDTGIYLNNGRFCVLLERRDEWQVGFVIPKGGYQQLRAAGIDAFHRELSTVVPWLAGRVQTLTDWRQMTLLSVESSRLKRWYLPGLLLIGDAAHVMSPVGGVGINYAVQDAVAAANLLAEPLRAGQVSVEQLAAVQKRREWPVRMIQAFQGFLQSRLVAPGLDQGKPFHMPLALRLLLQLPLLRQLPARVVGLGFGRERPRRARAGL